VKHPSGDPHSSLRTGLVGPCRRLLLPAVSELCCGITHGELAGIAPHRMRPTRRQSTSAAAVSRFRIRWSDRAMFHVKHWRRTHA
jgi:hypothetical protein